MKLSYGPAILLAAVAGLAWAQTPPKKPPGTPQVVLLANFQIVEGDVECVGNDIVVRRGKESTTYPVAQVACVGDSRDTVFRQMFARAQTGAPQIRSAMTYYPARVQPVLTNLCATCHADVKHESGFKLDRVQAGYSAPETSGRNATVVASFLTKSNPAASPLLVKMLTAHGGQREPAVRDASHPAYQNLELWVRSVVAEMPQVANPTEVKPEPTNAKPAGDDPYDPGPFNGANPMKR